MGYRKVTQLTSEVKLMLTCKKAPENIPKLNEPGTNNDVQQGISKGVNRFYDQVQVSKTIEEYEESVLSS